MVQRERALKRGQEAGTPLQNKGGMEGGAGCLKKGGGSGTPLRTMSTDHSLFGLPGDTTDSFDERKHMVTIFVDLSKAFDIVDYYILIKKLQLHGGQGNYLDWVKSYITNRKQYIES